MHTHTHHVESPVLKNAGLKTEAHLRCSTRCNQYIAGSLQRSLANVYAICWSQAFDRATTSVFLIERMTREHEVHCGHPICSSATQGRFKLEQIQQQPHLVELESSQIVVAEDTQPGLSIQARSIVDVLENHLELGLGLGMDLAHWMATFCLDATPIEIVADIQHKVRIAFRRSLLHLRRDQRLCMQINFRTEVAVCRTQCSSTETVGHLFGAASWTSMSRHSVRAWCVATFVLDGGFRCT